MKQPASWHSVILLFHRFLPQSKDIPVPVPPIISLTFCITYSYMSPIDFCSVDLVMAFVILATLKILIWLIHWLDEYGVFRLFRWHIIPHTTVGSIHYVHDVTLVRYTSNKAAVSIVDIMTSPSLDVYNFFPLVQCIGLSCSFVAVLCRFCFQQKNCKLFCAS